MANHHGRGKGQQILQQQVLLTASQAGSHELLQHLQDRTQSTTQGLERFTELQMSTGSHHLGEERSERCLMPNMKPCVH
jgi:hypothetical protein